MAGKRNFFITLQGVCDSMRRFLGIEIRHPATTSDYLSFCLSDIHCRVKEGGFLADGLCLYGDCDYVNTPFLAIPFKAVSVGTKDV